MLYDVYGSTVILCDGEVFGGRYHAKLRAFKHWLHLYGIKPPGAYVSDRLILEVKALTGYGPEKQHIYTASPAVSFKVYARCLDNMLHAVPVRIGKEGYDPL